MVNQIIENKFKWLIICLSIIGLTCTQKSPLDPGQTIHSKNPLISSITASPTSIGIGGMSIVRVLLLDENEKPYSNQTIQFSASSGTITASATTDSTGWAQVVFKSGDSEATALITAKYSNLATSSIKVSVIATPDVSLIMWVDRSTLYGNGQDTTWIWVELAGDSADLSTGQIIQLSSTAGKLANNGQMMFRSVGYGSIYFVSDVRKDDALAIVKASYKNYTNIDTVKILGLDFEILPIPTEILADGKSTASIQAILKESKSKVAIPGAKITFSADRGLIPKYATTNLSGLAEVDLTSSTAPGISSITAQFGQMKVDTSVIFLASEPTNLSVTINPPVIPSDGTTYSTITAYITDFSNNPVHSGIPVRFSKVSGPNVTFNNIGVTDSDGTASTQLTALGIGTAVIAIDVAGLRDTVTIECIEGPVSQITIKSDKSAMKADGIENATITATVMDANGYPLQSKTVSFTTDYGDITQTVSTNENGIAQAQFSSSVVGTSTITATVTVNENLKISSSLIIQLLAGTPATINLEFDPKEIGVKNTGQNQTVNIYATVKDNKNNIVDDGTLVKFSIIYSPPGVSFNTSEPIPTVAGVARISCSSGTVSGSARIRAEVLTKDGESTGISATSSELIIHAGPPYIEDINSPWTTHLQIVARRLNIWAGQDTTALSILVGDKYNNPVDPGTAIYITTSGGVVTTKSFTDVNGMVIDTIFAGNPFPSINRYYYYDGVQDPNTGEVLRTPVCPDFEGGLVPNSYDNGPLPGDPNYMIENNGIARIVAYAVGMDANGNVAKAWDQIPIVFSTYFNNGGYGVFDDNSAEIFPENDNTLYFLGASRTILIRLWDENGNPIASNSKVSAEVVPNSIQAGLSWTELETGTGMGKVYYKLTISNAIDPENPKPGWAKVKISVDSRNGIESITTESFLISLDETP